MLHCINIHQLRSDLGYTNMSISDDSQKRLLKSSGSPIYNSNDNNNNNNNMTMGENSADSRTPHDIYLEVSTSSYYFHQELLLTIGSSHKREL